jgi:DNA invertase Pin-like site-specific DNA recombinase
VSNYEFYVRRLAKNGVRLMSITQELGGDSMSAMMRQIMALFDEYQSKENAKHTLRAMRENARQGYWNGSGPPFGCKIVAAEMRGARTKKKIEPDPTQIETVRLTFRLARIGDGEGSMGVRQIAGYLNERRPAHTDWRSMRPRCCVRASDTHDLYWSASLQRQWKAKGHEKEPGGHR